MFTPLDLDDGFESFMRKVNPSVTQYSVQYRESRRAFMAGVALLYFHQISKPGMTDLDEEQAIKELESIGKQLVAFKSRVVEEKD